MSEFLTFISILIIIAWVGTKISNSIYGTPQERKIKANTEALNNLTDRRRKAFDKLLRPSVETEEYWAGLIYKYFGGNPMCLPKDKVILTPKGKELLETASDKEREEVLFIMRVVQENFDKNPYWTDLSEPSVVRTVKKFPKERINTF